MGEIFTSKDEEDWVAVKAEIFKETSTNSSTSRPAFHKLKPNFHVSWNDAEQQFCLTFNEHSRVKSDTKQRSSYTVSFAADQLVYIYKNLSALNADLAKVYGDSDDTFRDLFPEFPRTTWSEYFVSKFVAKPAEIKSWRSSIYWMAKASCPAALMDKLCLRLESYFSHAYHRCSHFAFMSTLFPDNFGCDEYFENMSELRHKSYVDSLGKAFEHFHFLLDSRRKSKVASKKLDVDDVAHFETSRQVERQFFDQLNSSAEEILDVLAEYYTYLREPFLDMREIAVGQIDAWKRRLDDADLGDRVKQTANEQLAARRREYRECVDSLHDLQLQYYKQTKSVLNEYLSALRAEKCDRRRHAGSSEEYTNTLQLIVPKMYEIEKRLAFAELNCAACQMWPVRNKRKLIMQKISHVDTAAPNLPCLLQSLESQFFHAQRDYFAAEIRTLCAKDKYLRTQLNEIRRITKLSSSSGQIDEDGDTFYDTADSEREIRKFLDQHSCDQPKIKSIKCQMENVNRQVAVLRTKKTKLEEKVSKGQGTLLSSLAYDATNSCHLKTILENEDNKKTATSKQKLKIDRMTTIRRIKLYRANQKKAGDTSLLSVTADECNNLPSIAPTKMKPLYTEAAKTPATPTPGEIPPPPPPPPPPPVDLLFSIQQPNLVKITDKSATKPPSSSTSVSTPAPKAGGNTMDSVLSVIKSGGVKLRKVDRSNDVQSFKIKKAAADSPNDRLLAEMMSKIRKMAHNSDEDDDDDAENDYFDSLHSE